MSRADTADIIWPWVIWAITLESSSTQHFHFSIISLWALLTFIFFHSNYFSVSHFKQRIYKYTNTATLCCQRCGHSVSLRDTQPALFVTLECCKSEIHLYWKITRHRHANSKDVLFVPQTTWPICHPLSREARPAGSIMQLWLCSHTHWHWSQSCCITWQDKQAQAEAQSHFSLEPDWDMEGQAAAEIISSQS